jgi:Ca2+-binding EF-hand superfamily protein
MMHKIDTNADGMVSQTEWDAYQQKLFAMMDADTSGALDKQEFMYSHPEAVASFATGGFANAFRTSEVFAKLDANHDGSITSMEFSSYQSQLFAMMDTAKTHMLDQTAFFGRGPAR